MRQPLPRTSLIPQLSARLHCNPSYAHTHARNAGFAPSLADLQTVRMTDTLAPGYLHADQGSCTVRLWRRPLVGVTAIC